MDLVKEIDWKKYTINFLLAYVISWIYFFITLPLFVEMFGKAKATPINYGLSWIIWFVAFQILNKLYPDGNNNNVIQ
jgi:hypothetical protein